MSTIYVNEVISRHVICRNLERSYRRKEVFERLCNDEAEVHGGKHPCKGVFAGLYDSPPVVALIILADTAS